MNFFGKKFKKKDLVKTGFWTSIGAYMGFKVTETILAIIIIILLLIGYYFVDKYNKEDTKLLREIQTGQYIGFFFWAIAVLPFLVTIIYYGILMFIDDNY